MGELNVWLDLRPALDGYSGIPQETRILFHGLANLPGFKVTGLIQSNNLVLEAGLPVRGGRIAVAPGDPAYIDRLSRVVVSLQQGPASHIFEHLRSRFLKFFGSAGAVTGSLLGRPIPLGAFDAQPFADFVWRAMFAKSLPVEALQAVVQADFRVMRWPWSLMNALGVASASLGRAAYPVLDTRGADVLVVETPYPGRPRRGTRLVVRYHDAIPLLLPHTVKNRGYHRSMHLHALRRNAADGAWFACVSDATRRDLLQVLPEVEPRTVTIPNIVPAPEGAVLDDASLVPEVVWSRKNRLAPRSGGAAIPAQDLEGGFEYLLMVCTLEPRKNHLTLLDAWERLRHGAHPRLNLVCVGSLGWDHDAILSRFEPWLERGGVHLLAGVPADELRLLYRHARATVCPSYAEGFDFAGIEAMQAGGLVAASDIPVHRDVYGEASVYFNPYSCPDMTSCLDGLLSASNGPQRDRLRAAGAVQAQRYLPQAVLPQWADFLQKVVA